LASIKKVTKVRNPDRVPLSIAAIAHKETKPRRLAMPQLLEFWGFGRVRRGWHAARVHRLERNHQQHRSEQKTRTEPGGRRLPRNARGQEQADRPGNGELAQVADYPLPSQLLRHRRHCAGPAEKVSDEIAFVGRKFDDSF